MDPILNHCEQCSHKPGSQECVCLCCCVGEFKLVYANCDWGVIERASVNVHGEPHPSVMRKIIDKFAPRKEDDVI